MPVALRPRRVCRDPLPPALQARHRLRRLAASGATVGLQAIHTFVEGQHYFGVATSVGYTFF